MKDRETVAIVLAAGRGSRMESHIPKQYLMLRDRPVLYYSLQAFQNSFINRIILVTGSDEIEYCQKELVEKYQFTKVTDIISGGKERYHSVYHGLCAAGTCDYVFIHDGARPFVTEEILQRSYQAVKEYGACAVGMPVKDTIKISNDNGFSKETPNRDHVWMIQTPQVFACDLIRNAYDRMIREEEKLLSAQIKITDDAMVMEQFTDHPVKFVEGSYSNIKITTPEDLKMAELLLL